MTAASTSASSAGRSREIAPGSKRNPAMGVFAPERERTRRTRLPVPPRRPRAQFPWGGLIAVAVAVVLIVGVRDWLPGLIPSLPNPFASETIDRSRPAVLQSIRDLSEYRASSGHFEVIVDIQHDTPLPAGLLGQRTLFVAVGDVDAVVDFSGLGGGAGGGLGDRRDGTSPPAHAALRP